MSVYRITLYVFLLIASFSFPLSAAPVVYKFSGNLTGFSGFLFPIDLIDTPFSVYIYGDTENAHYMGNVAGAGSLYANSSSNAVWVIDGFGTASSNSVQIYTLPGIGRICFGWDGEVFPLDTDNPAKEKFVFLGSEIGLDPTYGRLNSAVDEISLYLLTNLKNPPNMLPEYTTYIYFDEVGESFTLKEIMNVSYSVEPVPVPAAVWLLLSGLAGIISFKKYTKR